MNLEEYPAFRLGRHSKRPELRYSRTRTQEDGRTIEQLWIVRGAADLGLPGPLHVSRLYPVESRSVVGEGEFRL